MANSDSWKKWSNTPVENLQLVKPLVVMAPRVVTVTAVITVAGGVEH